MFRKVVLLVVLSAFALSASGHARCRADPTLKIAVLPILDALPMYAAEARAIMPPPGSRLNLCRSHRPPSAIR